MNGTRTGTGILYCLFSFVSMLRSIFSLGPTCYRTLSSAPFWAVKLAISLLCFNLCTRSQSHKEFSTRSTLCSKCITRSAPSYLCDWLQLYTPSRTLRSASDTLSLQIPRTRLSAVGSRAFSVFGRSTRNELPLPLRQKPSLDSYKSNLKTECFFPKQETCHFFPAPCCSLRPP